MTKFSSWADNEKARYIVDSLQNKDTPEETRDLIQGWFASDVNPDGKEIEMNRLLDIYFDKITTPSPWAYELLDSIHRNLNLPAPITKKNKASLKKKIFYRIAAIIIPFVILLIGTTHMLGIDDSSTEGAILGSIASISITDGVPYLIRFPDGSTARLSDGSTLSYPRNFMADRWVKLNGEAYFSIKKTDNKTFKVETDKITVSVLGTEFNVRSYDDEIEAATALISGKVEIFDNNNITTLEPMQQLTYNSHTNDSTIDIITETSSERWKTGKKIIRNTGLPETLNIVADFYNKQMIINGDLPKTELINTTLLESSSIETSLNTIQIITNNSFSFRLDGDKIYITTK